VFGERHLRHLLTEYIEHYNQERPHQAIGKVPPFGNDPPNMMASNVTMRNRLGGLLRQYEQAA
jgi:putative transposase